MKKIYFSLLLLLFTLLAQSQATDLFISEYAEGSSYNKYIEMYNGTGSDVNLSNYVLQKDVNGNNVYNNSLNLSGTLHDGDVFIVCHKNANPTIKNKANILNSQVINFNGNDQLQLLKNGIVIDHFGLPGGSNFAKDKTFVRNSSVSSGVVSWKENEWTKYPKDNWTDLGKHTFVNNQTAVSAPTFSPSAGEIISGTSITLQTTTNNAVIYYTLNGNDPSSSSTKYTSPINITSNTTIKAVAILNGSKSNIATATYTIKVSPIIINAPVATSAIDVSLTELTANWNSVSGADSYTIDISKSKFFGRPVNDNGLIISEVIEGSSNNKAVELYNGTANTINLSSYSIQKDVNGNNVFNTTISLSGNLESGKTYIICHSSADDAIKNIANIKTGSLNFNGNDQVRLMKGNKVIDFFGTSGGSNFNKNKTLIRKSNIIEASETYNSAAWEVKGEDFFDDLGSRSFIIDNSDFVSGYQNKNVGNLTSIKVSMLQSGNTYYYRVRAIKGTDESENSNVINVTTLKPTVTLSINELEYSEVDNSKLSLTIEHAEFIETNINTSTINLIGAPSALKIETIDFINSSTLDISLTYTGTTNIDYPNIYFQIKPLANSANSLIKTNSFILKAVIVEPERKHNIWYQPFNSPEDEFSLVNVSGNVEWEWHYYGNEVGSLLINGFLDDASESWFISPALDFYDFENIKFSFYHATRYDSNKGLEVLISTEYDGTSNPNEQGSWVNLTDKFFFPTTHNWNLYWSKEVDLSEYSNNTVYIAFKYKSTEDNKPSWLLENISVGGDYNENLVSDPIFMIESAVNSETTQIRIESKTKSSVVYYTLDESDPDRSKTLYEAPIMITGPITIKAIAYKNGFHSNIVTGSFGIKDSITIIPEAPVAVEATDLEMNSFVANWEKSEHATHYFIDVATNIIFEEDDSPSTDETTLIISEYIEGGSYNKAIELYNCTDKAIDLSNYILQKDVNGNNEFKNELKLSGTIQPKDVYVICHPKAEASIKTVANLEDGYVINFNGNDQIRLIKTDGIIIDYIGRPGGDNFAKDKTLVRKDNVERGSSTWKVGEWDVYEKNTFNYIGSHELKTKSAYISYYVPGYENLQLSDTTSLKIEGLEVGEYFYRVRAANEAGISDNSNIIKVTVTIDAVITETFTHLADLREAELGKNYLYTGQSVVTYIQEFRNQIYIQDKTAAILIDDPENIIQSNYVEGDGLTNLKGKLSIYRGMLQFTPIEDLGNPYSSNLSIDTLLYTGSLSDIDSVWLDKNQAKLVKIENVYFEDADDNQFEVGKIYNIRDVDDKTLNATNENLLQFRTSFYDADYIGDDLPKYTALTYISITGIINVRDSAFITARSSSDLISIIHTDVDDISISKIKVYQSDNNIIIDNFDSYIRSIQVINILGQTIYRENSNSSRIRIPIRKKGAYVISMKDKNGTLYNEKLIVR